MLEEALIRVEASSDELPAIDAAIRGYIQLLRFAVDSSYERDEVIAQLRSFQYKYEQPFMDWRSRQHSLKRPPDELTNPPTLISWQATAFELMAFGTAVIGYLHVLENTNTGREIRDRVVKHLLAFERRYTDRQKQYALAQQFHPCSVATLSLHS